MGETSYVPLSGPPGQGRIFSVSKKIRLQDTTNSGWTRLDAVARIISEVSEDDLLDFDQPNTGWWVARKIVLDVVSEAAQSQQLSCQTWAAGMARVGAERRVSLDGPDSRYEASTIWIAINPISGRPTAMPEWFAQGYANTCEGRRVSLRLQHPEVIAGADSIVWHLRHVDFDHHGHVNNRAYWPAVEEMLARYEFRREGQFRVEIEFRSGIPVSESVLLKVLHTTDTLAIWWLVDDEVAASAVVQRRADC